MGKIWAFILIIITIFGSLSSYLYINNLSLRRAIQELDKRKEDEFNRKLIQELGAIKKDLDEKYRADMVSFEALHKRSMVERQRVRELEEKLKRLGGKEEGSQRAP